MPEQHILLLIFHEIMDLLQPITENTTSHPRFGVYMMFVSEVAPIPPLKTLWMYVPSDHQWLQHFADGIASKITGKAMLCNSRFRNPYDVWMLSAAAR